MIMSGMLPTNFATPIAQTRNDDTEQQINTGLQQNLPAVEQRQTNNIPQMNTDDIWSSAVQNLKLIITQTMPVLLYIFRLAGNIITLVGTKNVMNDFRGYHLLSSEGLISGQPDLIIMIKKELNLRAVSIMSGNCRNLR